MNGVDNGLESAGQLFLVNKPVAQAGAVVVAVTEPAVVQNEGVHTETLDAVDDAEDFFLVKVEIGCLPVVDHDGARRGDVATIDQMVAVGIVVGAAHAANALV